MDPDVATSAPTPRRRGGRSAKSWVLLADSRPDLADQLVDQTLRATLLEQNRDKVWWRCQSTDHPPYEYQVASRTRVAWGTGCPVCTGHAVLVGHNDIATTDPDLADQLVVQTLRHTLTRGSGKRVEWECSNGHPAYVWPASPNQRTTSRSAGRCAVCTGRKALAGYNDLGTTHPELADQLVDQSLRATLTYGSSKTVWWACNSPEHPPFEWPAAVNNRTNLSQGCPLCSGHAVLPGYNDLATTHPELAKQLVDRSLAVKIPRCHYKLVWWQCPIDPLHVWEATPANRTTRQSGCPACALQWFTADRPAILYVLHHPIERLVKFGIANVDSIRLANFESTGWIVEATHTFAAGRDAYLFEQMILRDIRSNSTVTGLNERRARAAGRYAGTTEMFADDDPAIAAAFDLLAISG